VVEKHDLWTQQKQLAQRRVRGIGKHSTVFRPMRALPFPSGGRSRGGSKLASGTLLQEQTEEEIRMAPAFEVWQSPGGKTWEGRDQEEAILAGLQSRRPGVVTEITEVFDTLGQLRLRRIALFDDRLNSKKPA
jgi:hypothetical protein